MAKNSKIGKQRKSKANARYIAESHLSRNKAIKIERDKTAKQRHAAKHRKNGTLGYRARQLVRNETYEMRTVIKNPVVPAENVS